MEKVDIVDPDNRVIGSTTKEIAHKKGLLHRTVIAEVKDSVGRWLFVKQAPHKQDRGRFVSPMGGHVASGETVIQALKRETYEELGLKNFKYTYKGKVIFNRPVDNHTENHYFIVYEIYSDATPTLNDESVEYEKLSTSALKKHLKKDPGRFGDALVFLLKNLYSELLK